MRIRILTLLLALAMLVTAFVGCGGDDDVVNVSIDGSYDIVYSDGDPYAEKAAYLLCAAVRDLIGERLNVLSDKDYDAEAAEGRVICVGDTALLEEQPALDNKTFVFTATANGIVLRAVDPIALYLAAQEIVSYLETAGSATVTEEGLTVDRALCNRLNALPVDREDLLTVMSQNVRCADDGGQNNIVDRKKRLKQLVEDYSPDLLGTQEVTKTWMGIFEEYFGEEYGMIGCSRDGENATSGEWNTILYKKSRFDLVSSGTFWLTDTPDKPSFTDDALCRRICTWAILKDKVANREIMFCNTHLDHSNDTVRGAQAEILMDFIEDYVGTYPIFLTGDFNTTYGKEPYLEVTKTLVDSHRQAAVDVSDVKGTFHNYGTPGKEIDFCFYTGQLASAVAYRILSDDYDGFVSDHYGVISYFRYK